MSQGLNAGTGMGLSQYSRGTDTVTDWHAWLKKMHSPILLPVLLISSETRVRYEANLKHPPTDSAAYVAEDETI